MATTTNIIGKCPLCGGNVLKTDNGYRCENNTGDDNKCGLFINDTFGDRKMGDKEIVELLEKRGVSLNDPATGKPSTKVVAIAADGSISIGAGENTFQNTRENYYR